MTDPTSAQNVRHTTRTQVEAHIAPHATEFDRNQRVPPDVLQLIGEFGWWGAILPIARGGAGVGMEGLGVLHEEVGRGCSSVRSLLTAHTMVVSAVARWGTPEQRERWLPGLAAGSTTGALCLTETGAGSNPAGLRTTATPRSAAGHTLHGTKRWVTGGQTAGVLLVLARTPAGVTGFLVEPSHATVHVQPLTGLLGTRAAMHADISFDHTPVSPDALLGPDGFALHTVVPAALDIGRFSVASGTTGILQACLEASIAHTADSPLREHQLIQQMITRMVTDTQAARLLCARAGQLKDTDDPHHQQATWMAKYFAASAASQAAANTVQIHGAQGCSPAHSAQRHYRDTKIMEIIEGTTQLHEITIAQDAYQYLGGTPRP
ncbi:acyl-CoA dehydrogenase family protein [Streptomyces sp. NPDC001985]|uniref:acyl-CoA dehydrogenase family protein n=1 Tax=Streptomyces sp. NPDC001985 TaxID=3154406 RepID=UPI003328AAC0